MSNRLSANDRYMRDPVFYELVEMIYMVLCQQNFTPTEVREAAMLAAVKFEMMHVRPLFIDKKTGEISYGVK